MIFFQFLFTNSKLFQIQKMFANSKNVEAFKKIFQISKFVHKIKIVPDSILEIFKFFKKKIASKFLESSYEPGCFFSQKFLGVTMASDFGSLVVGPWFYFLKKKVLGLIVNIQILPMQFVYLRSVWHIQHRTLSVGAASSSGASLRHLEFES